MSGSEDLRPEAEPCAGASNATTENPAFVSGSTKGVNRPACPPQPCTRRTAGPFPHFHVGSDPDRNGVLEKRAEKRARSSRFNRGDRGGVRKSISARAEERKGERRPSRGKLRMSARRNARFRRRRNGARRRLAIPRSPPRVDSDRAGRRERFPAGGGPTFVRVGRRSLSTKPYRSVRSAFSSRR